MSAFHSCFEVCFNQITVAFNYHANIEHLDIVLDSVRFTVVYPTCSLKCLISRRLNTDGVLGELLPG